jgi:hypothetical protein
MPDCGMPQWYKGIEGGEKLLVHYLMVQEPLLFLPSLVSFQDVIEKELSDNLS